MSTSLQQWFLAQLDAEAPRTRRALENTPEGRNDWKPHEKSMALGYLTMLVSELPSWIALALERDSLDLQPPGGGSSVPHKLSETTAELVERLDANVAKAREALQKTTDAILQTTWKLQVAGKTVSEETRAVVIRDSFMHLAHHRGQLTVYLRLLGAKVPAIYGPSADDKQFH